MEVTDYEEGVMQSGVQRHVRQEHSGEATDQEVEHQGEREQHRQFQAKVGLPERAQEIEEHDARRDRDELRRGHEEWPQSGSDTACENMVIPHEPTHHRDTDHARYGQPIAEERFPSEDRQYLQHHSKCGNDEDVDLGMPEEPEHLLIEERAAPVPCLEE